MGEGVGGEFAGEGAGGRGREDGEVGVVVEAGGFGAEERADGAFCGGGEELREEGRGRPGERYSRRHGVVVEMHGTLERGW